MARLLNLSSAASLSTLIFLLNLAFLGLVAEASNSASASAASSSTNPILLEYEPPSVITQYLIHWPTHGSPSNTPTQSSKSENPFTGTRPASESGLGSTNLDSTSKDVEEFDRETFTLRTYFTKEVISSKRKFISKQSSSEETGSSRTPLDFTCTIPRRTQQSTPATSPTSEKEGAGEDVTRLAKEITIEKPSKKTPLSFLEDYLFHASPCAYRMEGYWTYELCHGKSIRQYHEIHVPNTIKAKSSGAVKSIQVLTTQIEATYTLGKYGPEQRSAAEKRLEEDPSLIFKPQRLMLGTDDWRPAFSVPYSNGDTCDLTGKPRYVNVLYTCHPESGSVAAGIIHRIKETATCEYEFVVSVPALCLHSSFKPSSKSKTKEEILCRPKIESSTFPPKEFKLEKESLIPTSPKRPLIYPLLKSGQHDEAAPGTQVLGSLQLEGGSVLQVEIKALDEHGNPTEFFVRSVEEEVEGEIEEVEAHEQGQLERQGPIAGMPPMSWSRARDNSRAKIDTSRLDAETLHEILSGKRCIEGGGLQWWKYELCYLKHALQYHNDHATGNRNNILLGRWNEKAHLDWIFAHPEKRPLADILNRREISQYYGGGDFCEENNRPRYVEVRYKCPERLGALSDSSLSPGPSSVSVMLLEPRTCEYMLVVEARLLCPLVGLVDAHGLLPSNSPLLEPPSHSSNPVKTFLFNANAELNADAPSVPASSSASQAATSSSNSEPNAMVEKAKKKTKGEPRSSVEDQYQDQDGERQKDKDDDETLFFKDPFNP